MNHNTASQFIEVEPHDKLSDLVTGNKGSALYAYYVGSDFYCDYQMFYMDNEKLLFYPAWENHDGSLRFTESEDGDDIQFVIIPYEKVLTMTIEELNAYYLDRYEYIMRIETPQSGDFVVLNTRNTPDQIINVCFKKPTVNEMR